MKKIFLLLVLCFGIYAAPALATPCDFPAGLVVLSGQVTNGSTPVYQATLVLTKVSDGTVCEVALTNPFGYFSFSPVFTQSYVLTVAKKGCEGFSNAYTLNDDRYVTIALNCG